MACARTLSSRLRQAPPRPSHTGSALGAPGRWRKAKRAEVRGGGRAPLFPPDIPPGQCESQRSAPTRRDVCPRPSPSVIPGGQCCLTFIATFLWEES